MVLHGTGVFLGLLFILGALRILLIGEVFLTSRAKGLPVQTQHDLERKWPVVIVRGRLKALPWAVAFFAAGYWLLSMIVPELSLWYSSVHTSTDQVAVGSAIGVACAAALWLQGPIGRWLARSQPQGTE